jgi:translation initiation factor 3 subunit M
MVVSSALVNVSDDAEVRLVALLTEAARDGSIHPNFAADCQTSIDAGQAAPLLDTILKDKGAMTALLTLEPRGDAVAAVSLLAALIERAERSIQDFVKALLADDSPETVSRKMTLLSVLYNMRADANEKSFLLQTMYQLAGSFCPQMLEEDQVLGALLIGETVPRIVAMLDAWRVTDRRELYRTIADVSSGEKKQRFLLLLIESYPDSVGAAKEAAIGAIRDPVSLFAQQRKILSMPAIQALAKEDANLFGILRVFQEGKLSDYQAYLEANGGHAKVLAPLGLEEQACLRNMKILSLCSLASEHEEVPYARIAETLQLPSNSDVESWVIAATSTGLLRAKMDQLRHVVMIERCVVRQFDTEQWNALQRRLQDWKQNVGGVLQSLKDAQSPA